MRYPLSYTRGAVRPPCERRVSGTSATPPGGAGDKRIGSDKKEITIASIRVVRDQVKVHNFATNPFATYVAKGVIVHSKGPRPRDGSKP